MKAQGRAATVATFTLGVAVSAAAMLVATASCAREQPPARGATLGFEQAFSAAAAPARQHFVVDYTDSRGTHRLEVWREGDARLRRTTDGVLDLFARNGGHGDDLSLTLRDGRRKLIADVSRDSLYRVGHGVDWFALAHGLGRPASSFTVRSLTAAPAVAPATTGGDRPLQPCRWYELSDAHGSHDVCWSRRLGLPVAIVEAGAAGAPARTVWRLVSSDSLPIAASVFGVDAQGYVRVDADRDIQAD